MSHERGGPAISGVFKQPHNREMTHQDNLRDNLSEVGKSEGKMIGLFSKTNLHIIVYLLICLKKQKKNKHKGVQAYCQNNIQNVYRLVTLFIFDLLYLQILYNI